MQRTPQDAGAERRRARRAERVSASNVGHPSAARSFIVNERDGQSLSAFEANLGVELSCLLLELKEKRYRAQPVKRAVIAKDDGGERLLGIPTVRDRVVQQALRSIIEPIFEPDFHPSSYGYRPGRSGHHAIGKAELFIRRYRREWVVDMDLSKCFDMLNHDLIIRQFRQRITDGSVLSLLRQFLESGVEVPGCGDTYKVHPHTGKEGGQTQAETQSVDETKPWLGTCGHHPRAESCAERLCQLLPGSELRTGVATGDELGQAATTLLPAQAEEKPGRLHRRLKQLGYRPPFKFIKMQSWRNAASPLAHWAIPNAYLHNDLRLMDLTKVQTGFTVPEFGVS